MWNGGWRSAQDRDRKPKEIPGAVHDAGTDFRRGQDPSLSSAI